MIPCADEICYRFTRDVIIRMSRRAVNIMAACFRTLKENQASYFKNYRLLYIHCVAKDDFEISLAYPACVKMICREIHVSFVDKMNERGVALVPRTVDERNVDDIFKDAASPVLICINSS